MYRKEARNSQLEIEPWMDGLRLDDVWTGINTRSTLLVWATAARYRNSMSIGLGDLAELNQVQ
ncbi:hypothetical protein BOTCAL_0325g00100 [Botryotinia calthae]|uniref:Uncharacterized protein n=1 Tax=Botryotinia calthae TaxID=38488 RepID=A0A4Y8CU29_9HELO|nr:hypothetical protein BOTCAL_0325g00100 [Botryotinia calthae]